MIGSSRIWALLLEEVAVQHNLMHFYSKINPSVFRIYFCPSVYRIVAWTVAEIPGLHWTPIGWLAFCPLLFSVIGHCPWWSLCKFPCKVIRLGATKYLLVAHKLPWSPWLVLLSCSNQSFLLFLSLCSTCVAHVCKSSRKRPSADSGSSTAEEESAILGSTLEHHMEGRPEQAGQNGCHHLFLFSEETIWSAPSTCLFVCWRPSEAPEGS